MIVARSQREELPQHALDLHSKTGEAGAHVGGKVVQE